MGITQQAYSILENRKGSIGFNTLLRFCDATDINIELLMATNIPITEENVEFFKANDLSVVLDGYRKMQQQLKFYESMITVKLAS
jgi:transcriptional regulator with XRE-family HTH domain